MLMSEIFEQDNRWRAFGRGFGQELARRYVPDVDFRKKSVRPASTTAAPAMTAPQTTVTQPTTPVTAQTSVAPATTAPVAPVVTAAPSQPAVTKPRVLAQPIRVGNKVYRPGDVMHARLSQMMQAQQQS
jgi:septum formation inhibitor MinC